MASSFISIPIDQYNPKRIEPLRGHWLEITCPNCSTVDDDGKRCPEPLFSYGNEVRLFYCHNCCLSEKDYKEEPAYILKRIENGCAVIEAAPGFKGKIEYCFYQRVVGATI